ncbi:Protein of unknown function [Pyronema omphalodes CBS 100304]|uniref:Uncharacterized protein n=1 Tax=Pyronema omphalodes (strain CBS 100304) TaxID=1076935 RepID=U4LQA7_PYROM|nr:Protein of unknown function [Pyronema omphalodes CBS 100304]
MNSTLCMFLVGKDMVDWHVEWNSIACTCFVHLCLETSSKRHPIIDDSSRDFAYVFVLLVSIPQISSIF